MPGYPYAYAVPDCAPWDGPATTIYLTTSPTDSTDFSYPQLRLSVYQGHAALPGNSFVWPGDRQVGNGIRCVEESGCVAASSGRITFGAAAPDGGIQGTAELRFPDGTSVTGAFHAIWREPRMFCG
jgi:hypothetical protein